MEIIREGQIKLKVPKNRSLSKKDKIFYNPVMEANRDISIAVVQGLLSDYKREDFIVCDPLGGSGVRGLRYAKELINPSGRVKVIIGDINPNAIKLAMENLKINDMENVEIIHKDANILLSENFRTFNMVDLDPFGSPNPYIDSAIRSCITKNGLLSMTATDTAVLYGTYRKTCIRNYDAIPISGDKELAIRLLIGYAIRMASKYDIGLKPIFSHFTDHYVRTFLITERGAKKADNSLKKLGYIRVENEEKIIKLREKGFERGFGGVFYLGSINDRDIVKSSLKVVEDRNYSERSKKIIKEIYEESALSDVIGCYDIHKICSNIKELAPPIHELINRLKEQGFKASRTHYNPNGIKTDGKVIDVINCIREYNENNKY
ncbi:tRNA (guanine(26)-N(2))-dimethyltransferase [Methanothermococcus sp. SCGC AD-155-M21]|nr:tRNA (guanine(26)-N(2))-dimethyltransferase [Methanothermococcus sp. SCGC AD-155-M21]